MTDREKYIYTEYSVEKMIDTALTPLVHRNNRADIPTNWARMNKLRERMRVNLILAIEKSLREIGV